MKKLLYFLTTLFIVVGFISCTVNNLPTSNNVKPKIVKQEAYNTTILLFYSNHHKKVVGQTIKN